MPLFTNYQNELQFYRQLLVGVGALVYVIDIETHRLEWIAPNCVLSRVFGMGQITLESKDDKNNKQTKDYLASNPEFGKSTLEALQHLIINPDANYHGIYRLASPNNEVKWWAFSAKTLTPDASSKATKAAFVAIEMPNLFSTPEAVEAFSNIEKDAESIDGPTTIPKEGQSDLSTDLSVLGLPPKFNVSSESVVEQIKESNYLYEANIAVTNEAGSANVDRQQQSLTYFPKSENPDTQSKKSSMEQIPTEREIEVLILIAKQYTSEEISKRLFIAKSTVDTHRKRLIQKLNVKNSVGLGLYALRHKLI